MSVTITAGTGLTARESRSRITVSATVVTAAAYGPMRTMATTTANGANAANSSIRSHSTPTWMQAIRTAMTNQRLSRGYRLAMINALALSMITSKAKALILPGSYRNSLAAISPEPNTHRATITGFGEGRSSTSKSLGDSLMGHPTFPHDGGRVPTGVVSIRLCSTHLCRLRYSQTRRLIPRHHLWRVFRSQPGGRADGVKHPLGRSRCLSGNGRWRELTPSDSRWA